MPTTRLGKTPLHLAAENGHIHVCRFLLKNIQGKMPKTLFGKTPEMLALENGHFEVKLLLTNPLMQYRNKSQMNDIHICV